jgi:hypothetical protein
VWKRSKTKEAKSAAPEEQANGKQIYESVAYWTDTRVGNSYDGCGFCLAARSGRRRRPAPVRGAAKEGKEYEKPMAFFEYGSVWRLSAAAAKVAGAVDDLLQFRR